MLVNQHPPKHHLIANGKIHNEFEFYLGEEDCNTPFYRKCHFKKNNNTCLICDIKYKCEKLCYCRFEFKSPENKICFLKELHNENNICKN